MLKTVAIVLINDSFLQGKIENRSLRYLLYELNLLDYQVEKISVVREDEKVIIYELNTLTKQFDVVLIVGELNDNVFKALADVTFQEPTSNFKLKNLLNTPEDSSGNYQLPVSAKILTVNDYSCPVIQLQTIFILKEQCLEKLFSGILRKRLEQFRMEVEFKKILYLQMNGNTNVILDKIKNSDVKVSCEKSNQMLAVTLETASFDSIVECEKLLRNELRSNVIESVIKGTFQEIYSDPDEQIQLALENIEKGLADYKPDNVFLSFNGGKDCTVLLHLMYAVLRVKYPDYHGPITCLYVKSDNAFVEQDKFISQCEIFYNLKVITVKAGIKESLSKILQERPNLKACFMGTRRTDPFSSDLKTFQITDSDWPQVMRVCPLLDWHYSDIWNYLLYYKVPYCKLYDMGYTSLGSATNTIRNSCLQYRDVYTGVDTYLPAYKMLNENKERNGRDIR